jgi:hypothetical protein
MKHFISLLTSASALALSYYDNYVPIYGVVGSYLIGDLFTKNSPDMVLHHVLSLIFLGSTLTLNPEEYPLEARAMVNVEISTLFLSANHLYTNQLCKVLFVSTFIKYRIWDYYWVFITKETFKNPITKASVYGLFCLNLYWLALIWKKVLLKKPRLTAENVSPPSTLRPT